MVEEEEAVAAAAILVASLACAKGVRGGGRVGGPAAAAGAGENQASLWGCGARGQWGSRGGATPSRNRREAPRFPASS